MTPALGTLTDILLFNAVVIRRVHKYLLISGQTAVFSIHTDTDKILDS